MDPNRGALANVDRRLLAKLDREEKFQMVRLPVSPAKWSTWKRYCGAVGTSIGRAIVALIDRELASVAEASLEDSPVLSRRRSEQLVGRAAEVANRERAVSEAEKRQRGTSERLRRWEAELQMTAQRLELAAKLTAQRRDTTPKVGRNDHCPCGSGLKYKHCHGLTGRPPNVVYRQCGCSRDKCRIAGTKFAPHNAQHDERYLWASIHSTAPVCVPRFGGERSVFAMNELGRGGSR